MRPLYLLSLYALTGVWPSGSTVRYVYEIALDHINKNPNVLPGYELKVIWKDTQCHPGLASFKAISGILTPPTKVMILGASCSICSLSMADFAPFYNLVQLSPESVSPQLSDISRYPTFFRMWPPETHRNPLIIDLMKTYNWQKAATITEVHPIYSTVTDHLIGLMEQNNITLLTVENFQDDPTKAVKALKEVDARIIVLNCYQEPARKVMCESYKNGHYGTHIVWHLIGWYSPNWWSVQDVDCSPAQILMALQGAIYAVVAFQPLDKDVIGVSGFTSAQLDALIYKNEEDKNRFTISQRFYFYDAVWACALALNDSIEKLGERGKSLSDFNYTDAVMGKIIKDSMQDLVFEGGLGLRQYDKYGDSMVNFEFTYQSGDILQPAGTYVYDKDGRGNILWTNTSQITWLGGRVPSDSTRVIDRPLYMSLSIFTALLALSSIGILVAVICLTFNITFRNKRIIKMSSPRMNNVILLGCISVFTTVFFYEQDELLTQAFCTIRYFTLTIGFSLVFGSLFAKTWRVHIIFASKKAKTVGIQDTQLLCIVLVIVTVNTVTLVTWFIVDPFNTAFITTTNRVLDSAEDIVIRYRVSVCVSAYSSIFTGILYITQAAILAFGAFLAWETKKVQVEALNDSQLIGTCIYNVLILSALGVGLGYVLSHEIHLVYALNATFMILATFCTQCTIFIPKVISVFSGKSDVMPTTVASATDTEVESGKNDQDSQSR